MLPQNSTTPKTDVPFVELPVKVGLHLNIRRFVDVSMSALIATIFLIYIFGRYPIVVDSIRKYKANGLDSWRIGLWHCIALQLHK